MVAESSYQTILRYVGLLALAVGLAIAYQTFIPAGINDYARYFEPATQFFIDGKNPYDEFEELQASGDVDGGVFNPPWTYALLAPLVLTPIGRGLNFVISFALLALTLYKFRPPLHKIVLFFLCLPTLVVLLGGNTDAWVLAGFFLPAWAAYFFYAIKPQLGIGPAVVDFVKLWHDNGQWAALKSALPLVIATLVSFGIYGFWFVGAFESASYDWNIAPWVFIGPLTFAIGAVWALVSFWYGKTQAQARLMLGLGFWLSTYSSYTALSFVLLATAGAGNRLFYVLWLLFNVGTIYILVQAG
jgi:hypothetical protein